MTRSYDSRKRKKAAEETRRQIIQAALQLHWDGITEFEPLAAQAECSLPTVRKHFPSKEALFGACTGTFAETLTMPDLPGLSAISDPPEKISTCVSELCRIHEAMLGYAWLCVRMRKDSPTLDLVMREYEGLADAIAGLLGEDAGSTKGVRGVLDFLTYRAMRVSAGLSPEETQELLIRSVRHLQEEEPHRHDHQ